MAIMQAEVWLRQALPVSGGIAFTLLNKRDYAIQAHKYLIGAGLVQLRHSCHCRAALQLACIVRQRGRLVYL